MNGDHSDWQSGSVATPQVVWSGRGASTEYTSSRGPLARAMPREGLRTHASEAQLALVFYQLNLSALSTTPPAALLPDDPKLDRMSLRTMPDWVSTLGPLNLPSPGYGPPVSVGITEQLLTVVLPVKMRRHPPLLPHPTAIAPSGDRIRPAPPGRRSATCGRTVAARSCRSASIRRALVMIVAVVVANDSSGEDSCG